MHLVSSSALSEGLIGEFATVLLFSNADGKGEELRETPSGGQYSPNRLSAGHFQGISILFLKVYART
jgi:hypothetical protein